MASIALVTHRAQSARAATAPAGAAAPAAGADSATSKAGAGPLAATVNGIPIYQADIDRVIATISKSQKVDPSAIPRLQAEVLKQVIGNVVLSDFLKNQKDLSVRAELTTMLNDMRGKLRSQNMTLDAYLASINKSEEAFRSELAMKLMMQKYAAKIGSEEGMKQYFEDHKATFDGTVRRVSHVLLRPEGAGDQAEINRLTEQAKSIREQLQSGQLKFDEAATKFSAGPSRQRGGDLGFVTPGVMDPTFTNMAYSLKLDEVSEPVATPFGIHLIKVTEIKAGTKTLDDVKQAVQGAYMQSLITNLTDEQMKAAKIEFPGNFPHFKPGTDELVLPDGAAAPSGAAPPASATP